MKYDYKINLLAVIIMITTTGSVLASSHDTMPPLDTKETTSRPPQKKSPEERVDRAIENVARETGKGVAKVGYKVHNAKNTFNKSYKKEKIKLEKI